MFSYVGTDHISYHRLKCFYFANHDHISFRKNSYVIDIFVLVGLMHVIALRLNQHRFALWFTINNHIYFMNILLFLSSFLMCSDVFSDTNCVYRLGGQYCERIKSITYLEYRCHFTNQQEYIPSRAEHEVPTDTEPYTRILHVARHILKSRSRGQRRPKL